MIFKIVHSDLHWNFVEELTKIIIEKDPQSTIETYNEDYYKEKKKGILIKASCGTRMIPFVSVYADNKELIKAFYGEDGSNNINNIKRWVQTTN